MDSSNAGAHEGLDPGENGVITEIRIEDAE